jgi:hypothetical protein
MGSNTFYIPSPNEIEEENDPEQKAIQEESEINIE